MSEHVFAKIFISELTVTVEDDSPEPEYMSLIASELTV
jgi:hypothetical protein